MLEFGTSYLSRKDVCLRYDISRSSLYRRVKEGRFPYPVKIAGSPRTLRWSLKDLEAFESDQCEVSLGKPTDKPSPLSFVPNGPENSEIVPPKASELPAQYLDSSSAIVRHGLENVGVLGFSASMLEAPKRLLNCLRHPVHRDVKPTIHYFKKIDDSLSISFRGLQRCELWSCPVCAPGKAKALDYRLKQKLIELGEKGCSQFFVTFTFGHELTDTLAAVYGDLIAVWRRFVTHSDYKNLMRTYGFQIHFWVRELEFGVSGWHPHVHAVVEFAGDSSLLQEKLTNIWIVVCYQVNRPVNRDRGVCVSKLRADASAYLLKQWTVSKGDDGFARLTAFQLGYSAFRTGNRLHELLFREYLQFSRSLGRHRQFFLSGKCDDGRDRAAKLPVMDEGSTSILQLSRVNLIEIRECGMFEFLRRQNFL